MPRKIKADLHMHPHFYNPRDSNRTPNLLQIINKLFKKRLEVTSLSACHPKQGRIDYRFFDYMTQQYLLERDFETSYEKGKVLYVERKTRVPGQPNSIYVLNSQEVRTDYKGMPADINIIGVERIIQPGQGIEESAKIGREEGGIVTICHPNGRCGAGIEKALEMHSQGKAHAIEIDSTSSQNYTLELNRILIENGLKGLPVSDSHHISQAGTSYALFDRQLIEEFSLESLKDMIKTRKFLSHIREIGEISKFLHHTSHILISIPGHLITNPAYIIKVLTKRK